MQTSVPGVYAIGDVASFPLLCAGGAAVRQEHVTHARSSAAQAAQAIMGEQGGRKLGRGVHCMAGEVGSRRCCVYNRQQDAVVGG